MLLMCALWGAVAFGAIDPAVSPENETSELRYWKKVHDQEAQQAKSQEEQQRQRREEVKASLPDLVRAGETVQPDLIAAQDGPPESTAPATLSSPYTRYLIPLFALAIFGVAVHQFTTKKETAESASVAAWMLSEDTLPPPQTGAVSDNFTTRPAAGPADFASPPDLPEGFSVRALKILAELPQLMQEVSRASDYRALQKTLDELREQITLLKKEASVPQLRPVWQMTDALEKLLGEMLGKSHAVTPSTVRTVVGATELLYDLCKPELNADLATDPPIRLLTVDDDALCRRAVTSALQRAFQKPDEAANGEAALARVIEKSYDVIFLDIEMPGMDGFTLCSRIRNTVPNRMTPVVFVTSHTDLESRHQSSLNGGSDFMAKPFLGSEIIVKAFTFALRGRLENPARIAEFAGPAGTAEGSAAPFGRRAAALLEAEQLSAPCGNDAVITHEFNGDFFTEAPGYLAVTRRILEKVSAATDETERQDDLGGVLLRVHTFTTQAQLNQLQLVAHVGSSLQALLKRLHQNPKTVTSSTLNTVSSTLNLLELFCKPDVQADLADHSPIKILVVEDEPLARRAVVGALQLAFEKPDSADQGAAALVLTAQKPYDVIFTDVEMPAMNGFELCKFIRTSGPNRITPVIFITNHTDPASRAQATESGGTDFIAKPFLPIEITVKALTFAWQTRLRKLQERAAAAPSSVQPRSIPAREPYADVVGV